MRAWSGDAVVQAFIASAIALVGLKLLEGQSFRFVMSTGRYGGGGALVVSAVFLGVLAYRFGQAYLKHGKRG